MHVIRHDAEQVTPVEAPIFRGDVARRALVGAEQSEQVTVLLVRFAPGGRNVFHRHTFDQVLYVTEGEGIVASETEEHIVRAGDTIVIPAGERHWHGATDATSMAHLAIGTPGTTELAE